VDVGLGDTKRNADCRGHMFLLLGTRADGWASRANHCSQVLFAVLLLLVLIVQIPARALATSSSDRETPRSSRAS